MGACLSVLTTYNWYDWLMVLNPLYVPRRLQMHRYRLFLLADLYLLLPLLRIKNYLTGSDRPTPAKEWDYDESSDVDHTIVEPQLTDLSKSSKGDFLSNKHGPYVRRSLELMNRVMPRYVRGEVADELNGTSLYNFITTTSLSFSTSSDGKCLDLTIFSRVPDDPDRVHPKLPGYKFELNHEKRTARVVDEKGSTIPPDEPDVAVVLSSALLAFTHSFVHFHLPTAVALFSDKLSVDPIKRESRMAQLLGRHTRFTLVFNFAGHNMFFPVQRQRSNWSFPYCFRITQKDFAFVNVARTQNYYNMTGKDRAGRYVSGMCQYEDRPKFDDRFVFHRMVGTYYDYVDTYVREFGVEHELLDEFVRHVETLVPTITIEDPMTMLVTLIWQVSVLHSTDHDMIYQQSKYMAFGNPRDPWNVAVSRFVLDTYVRPYMVPGEGEGLSNYVDIVGLPHWDRMCSSISF